TTGAARGPDPRATPSKHRNDGGSPTGPRVTPVGSPGFFQGIYSPRNNSMPARISRLEASGGRGTPNAALAATVRPAATAPARPSSKMLRNGRRNRCVVNNMTGRTVRYRQVLHRTALFTVEDE